MNNSTYVSPFDIDSDGDIDGEDINAGRAIPVDFNEDGYITTADSDFHQAAREAYETAYQNAQGAPSVHRTLTTTWGRVKSK